MAKKVDKFPKYAFASEFEGFVEFFPQEELDGGEFEDGTKIARYELKDIKTFQIKRELV